MTQPDRARVKRVFLQVSEAPRDQWGELLDELCADAPEVRARVESLLKADESEHEVLDGSALDALPLLASDRDVRPDPVGDVGPYTIVAKIGEGGMGAVYEARQANPDRAVALKLIHSSVATAAQQHRFQREALALGRLEHVGIARVYESGQAPVSYSDGSKASLPFIAMEYVRGATLMEYVAGRQLRSVDKLELLAKIADAAHYAHQKSVIHRDLKPANILVTEEGQPKVLDFGVAALTDANPELSIMQTLPGQVVGTLTYMSPEQIDGAGEVDTRSDVYALGVIAYEVLSGAPPLDVGSVSLAHAARTIMESEPRSLGSVSSEFRGDVATIVDKALEKRPEDRYASAAEFAADLRRFLAKEPIVARPPSGLYVARKFAARHKAVVVGALAVFVTLAVGVVVSTDLWLEADAERGVAAREASRAKTVSSFMESMLFSVSPEVAKKLDTRLLRKILDDTVQRLDAGELAEEPLVEAELRATIGKAFDRISAFDRAIAMFEHALRIREAQGETHTEATLDLMLDLSAGVRTTNDLDRTERILRTIVQRMGERGERFGPEHPLSGRVEQSLAYLLVHRRRHGEAIDHFLKTLDAFRRQYGEQSNRLVPVMSALGGCYTETGKLEQAITLYEKLLEKGRRIYGEDHPSYAMLLNNVSQAYIKTARLDLAEQAVRQSVAIHRATHDAGHARIGMVLHSLGEVLLHKEDAAGSEAAFREALAILSAAYKRRHPHVAQTRVDLGKALVLRGAFAAAVREMEAGYGVFAAIYGATAAPTKSIARTLAQAFAGWERAAPSEARRAAELKWERLGSD